MQRQGKCVTICFKFISHLTKWVTKSYAKFLWARSTHRFQSTYSATVWLSCIDPRIDLVDALMATYSLCFYLVHYSLAAVPVSGKWKDGFTVISSVSNSTRNGDSHPRNILFSVSILKTSYSESVRKQVPWLHHHPNRSLNSWDFFFRLTAVIWAASFFSNSLS
jgi:hypothetical protein